MRHNLRLVSNTGKLNKRTDRYDWQTGGVVGFTVEQITNIVDLAADYRANDSKSDGSPDYDSYHGEQSRNIAMIREWIAAGPLPYDKTKPGLYRSRGNEVVILMGHYSEWHNITTQSCLRLYDLVDKSNVVIDEDAPYVRDAKEIAALTPAQNATRILLNGWDKKVRDDNHAKWDAKNTPISKMTGHAITKRLADIKKDRKFRLYLASMFDAPTPEVPEVVAVARPTVYVKVEQRPTGPTYDLPVPKVAMGDRLRPSLVRSADFAYYRREYIRDLITHFRPKAKKRSRTVQNLRLPDYAKSIIRDNLAVMDNCYEIEVAGLIPFAMNVSESSLGNQCYVGGGSGWGGIAYKTSLLFRGEHQGNQVAILLHDGPQAVILPRYVMALEETK